MKRHTITLALIIGSLITLSCKKNHITPQVKDVDLLTASAWGMTRVTNETDGDLSLDYQKLVIQFNSKAADGYDGTFIFSAGGHAFPESAGKFKIDSNLKKITLDSGRTMDYVISAGSLTLDFLISPVGGRTKGLSGHFTIDFHHI